MCLVDAFGQDSPVPVQTVGWYCHIPFCASKCEYCDFYSIPLDHRLAEEFLRAILREILIRDPHRPVESVFVGGGTPTVLPGRLLDSLLAEISRRTGPVAEFSVEANPGSADELKLALLASKGVNRISFGVQSFLPQELAILGRLHTPADIQGSISAARAVGFHNLSLDLIYAIPGQTLQQWRDNLRRAVDLEPKHVSCYALTYEEGTGLTRLRDRGGIVPCDENLEIAMFESALQELSDAGFEHYEISNFAQPGWWCRANMIYWRNQEYFGVGPSAVSYLVGVRKKNVSNVRDYIERMRTDPSAVVVEREQLSPLGRASETAIQMLRLTDGIAVDVFRLQTGRDPLTIFRQPIEQFRTQGLLEATPTRIRLTHRGMLVANRVMAEFLLEDGDAPPV
jgi:oxygen-independent coproporphyrinogen III oxidase